MSNTYDHNTDLCKMITSIQIYYDKLFDMIDKYIDKKIIEEKNRKSYIENIRIIFKDNFNCSIRITMTKLVEELHLKIKLLSTKKIDYIQQIYELFLLVNLCNLYCICFELPYNIKQNNFNIHVNNVEQTNNDGEPFVKNNEIICVKRLKKIKQKLGFDELTLPKLINLFHDSYTAHNFADKQSDDKIMTEFEKLMHNLYVECKLNDKYYIQGVNKKNYIIGKNYCITSSKRNDVQKQIYEFKEITIFDNLMLDVNIMFI